jgi:hypothetical protein
VFRDGQIFSEPVGRSIKPGRRAAATLSVGAEQVGRPSWTSGTGDVQRAGKPN